MEQDEISEIDQLFFNTQAQSNLDMWDDSIQKQNSENVFVTSLQQRFAFKDDLDRVSALDTKEPPNCQSSDQNQKIIFSEKKDRTERKKTNKDKKILASTTVKKRKKTNNAKGSQKLESIGAHVTKLYSEQKNSLYRLLSGKKKKMNDLLSTIDEIENGKSDGNSNELIETQEQYVSEVVYSKDEWFNLLKVIRVNFPNLSKKSKLTLSKINKEYEAHYDSSATEIETSRFSNSIEDETPVLWNMASSFPKTRLTDEDLKWLYDLYDNGSKFSGSSSFGDTDQPDEENNIYTLSQLIDKHRNLKESIPDIGSNLIDLTQNFDDVSEKKKDCDTVTYQSIISTSDSSKSNNDQSKRRFEEIITPNNFSNDEVEFFIPCSSPRASPIIISSKRINEIKKKLNFAKDSDIRTTITASPQGQENENNNLLNYRKSFDNIENNTLQHINDNNSSQIEVIPDSETDDALAILSSNAEVFTSAQDKIEPSLENTLGSYDWKDPFSCDEHYLTNEKINTLLKKDKNEVNQLQCLSLDLSQETQIPESDVDSCKSGNLSKRSRVRSSCNLIKKKTRYEFKGHLSSVFEAPFGKFIETNITHEKRSEDPEVILDTDSENDGEISIIEIVKEVQTKKDAATACIYRSSNNSLEPKSDNNFSEIQVFSSQNKNDSDVAETSEANNIRSPTHPFVNSSVLQTFNDFTVIGTRLLLSKWGFKSKKNKIENSRFLSTIYTIICTIKKDFSIEIQSQNFFNENETKEVTAKNRQKTINQFYDKLSMLKSRDVQNALFNFISDVVEEDEILYSKILKYIPITLTEIQKLLQIRNIDIDKEILRAWADSTSVSYSMEWRTSSQNAK